MKNPITVEEIAERIAKVLETMDSKEVAETASQILGTNITFDPILGLQEETNA